MYIITILAALLLAAPTSTPPTGELRVEVRNIGSAKGDIWIGVFDKADTFLEDDAQAYGKVFKVAANGTQSYVLPGVAHGRYAISVFHDENGNGKLDKNFWGVPKEPFAFSRDARAKFSKPDFKDADFDFGAGSDKVVVTLREWKDM